MRKIRVRTGDILLLATVLGAAGPMFAQFRDPGDIRSALFGFRGIEQPLSEAIVNGVQVTFPDSPAPSIRFLCPGIISGSAGVNRYFANVQVMPDGAFTIQPPGLALTRMVGDAQHMAAEATFLNALQSTRFLRLDAGGVVLESADQTTRLKFARPVLSQSLSDVFNVELVLVRFVSNGKELTLPSSSPITLTFQDGGQLSGKSTVNNYAGVYTATPNGEISLRPTTAGQMAGPPDLMALEKAYFDAMPMVNRFRLEVRRVFFEGDATTLEFAFQSAR